MTQAQHSRKFSMEEFKEHSQVAKHNEEKLVGDNPPVQREVDACISTMHVAKGAVKHTVHAGVPGCANFYSGVDAHFHCLTLQVSTHNALRMTCA